MSECCESCLFYFCRGKSGFCRRYPPTSDVFRTRSQQISVIVYQDYEPKSWHPPVTSDDWCGEYQPNPPKE